MVVIGHADMYLGLFEEGISLRPAFGYLSAHAHAAVMVFFVISGFMVAYSTNNKSRSGNYDFRGYFLDRWSRIYSVLFAAIGFTLALDFVGSNYSSVYSNPAFIPQDRFVLRLIVNLISIQGIWGYRIQLGSNPALWSVGYEFVYYILFGVLYFREKIFNRSWFGVVLIMCILGIIGWKMAAYFSIWMAGVAAYYASNFETVKKYKLSVWLVTAMIILANHLINFLNIFDANEVVTDIVFAIVIATLLTFEVKHTVFFLKTSQKINTYMADFSYSIYAFHTPVIFFVCSLLFEYWNNSISSLFSGLILVTVSIVIARALFFLTELRRAKFRLIADQFMSRVGI